METEQDFVLEYNGSIPIVYVNHGIANRFSNRIEINENLKKYPALFKQVLIHETSHTDKKFSFKDLFMDMGLSTGNTKDLIKFILTNPKSLSQILPVYVSNKKIIFDVNMIIIYLFLFGVITIAITAAFFI